MKRSVLRAITIDLDDTLWPVWPTIRRAEALAQEWLAERAPAVAAAWPVERLRTLRAGIQAERVDLRHDLLGIRRAALQVAFRDAGADDPESRQLIEGALDVFMAARNEVTLYPEVVSCLERLSSAYRIATLSNGNASVHRIGIGHLFHATVSAHVHRASKPDPALFHAACRELGCAPGETVHIGDDADLDVRGARAAGLHAVWINRAGHSWQGDDRPVTVPDLEAFETWLEHCREEVSA